MTVPEETSRINAPSMWSVEHELLWNWTKELKQMTFMDLLWVEWPSSGKRLISPSFFFPARALHFTSLHFSSRCSAESQRSNAFVFLTCSPSKQKDRMCESMQQTVASSWCNTTSVFAARHTEIGWRRDRESEGQNSPHPPPPLSLLPPFLTNGVCKDVAKTQRPITWEMRGQVTAWLAWSMEMAGASLVAMVTMVGILETVKGAYRQLDGKITREKKRKEKRERERKKEPQPISHTGECRHAHTHTHT